MNDIPYGRPVVIVGGLAPHHRDRVRQFALQLNAPVYAEPLSGLREDRDLASLLITSSDRMIARGGFDSVIRVGNVPTLRFWRDLEESQRDLSVVHFSPARFAGLSRGELKGIDELPGVSPREREEDFFERDRRQARAFHELLDAEPQSEPAIVRQLSRDLPQCSRIYLGNSLPVREWDLAATRESRGHVVEANRGANGIDGQLSTFLGWCAPYAENIALIGDLTALYDLNAPWIVPQLDREIRFRIVIINNAGGRIFSRVPSLRKMDAAARETIIENAHSLTFESWAAMFRLPYNDRDAPRSVIELKPDSAASKRVWQRYDELWT